MYFKLWVGTINWKYWIYLSQASFPSPDRVNFLTNSQEISASHQLLNSEHMLSATTKESNRMHLVSFMMEASSIWAASSMSKPSHEEEPEAQAEKSFGGGGSSAWFLGGLLESIRRWGMSATVAGAEIIPDISLYRLDALNDNFFCHWSQSMTIFSVIDYDQWQMSISFGVIDKSQWQMAISSYVIH